MRLLSQVLEHAPDSTLCAVDAAASELFAGPDGRVPGWVAIEWMAQAIAVHGGLLARARGEAPRVGLFLGSRRVELARDDFGPEERLRVRATHERGDAGLLRFACRVEAEAGAPALASGVLLVYLLDDLSRLPEGIDGAAE
jgi:predicted hotdog family 3-hydroxylacyl-ACP dehydratase